LPDHKKIREGVRRIADSTGPLETRFSLSVFQLFKFWSPQRPIYTSFRFRFSALRSDQPTSVLWPLASRLLPHAVSRMPYAFPSPLACHAVLSRRKEAEAEAARRRITHYHGSLVAAATRLPYASCRMRGEAA
jgi:hypothetical protein